MGHAYGPWDHICMADACILQRVYRIHSGDQYIWYPSVHGGADMLLFSLLLFAGLASASPVASRPWASPSSSIYWIVGHAFPEYPVAPVRTQNMVNGHISPVRTACNMCVHFLQARNTSITRERSMVTARRECHTHESPWPLISTSVLYICLSLECTACTSAMLSINVHVLMYI